MPPDTAPAAAAAAPAAPLTPAAADLLQPQQMTPEVAAAKRVEMLGNAGFRERVLRAEPEALAAWKAVHAALRPPANSESAESQQYAKNMDSLAILKAKADLPDAVWDHVAARGPVSLKERQDALFAKQRNLKSAEFVKKYLDGDRQANSEMTLINMTLASPIGSYEEIEAFKAKAAKRLSGK